MRFIRLTLASTALALTSCASGNDLVWHKSGASDAELQTALYECERDTRTAATSFSGGVFGAGEAQAFGQRCMASKGWSLQALGPDHKATLAPVPASYFRNVQCRFSDPPQVLPGTAGFCIKNGGTIVGEN